LVALPLLITRIAYTGSELVSVCGAVST